jgi:hypothetical protein
VISEGAVAEEVVPAEGSASPGDMPEKVKLDFGLSRILAPEEVVPKGAKVDERAPETPERVGSPIDGAELKRTSLAGT